ncbi:MAG: hypothetical protein ACRCTI_10180 [Beijerinckiaceae bacterium]
MGNSVRLSASVAAAAALVALSGAAAAVECPNPSLGRRAAAVAAADARISALDVSADEKTLAGLDRTVRSADLAAALRCLTVELRRQGAALPAELAGYPGWRTDGMIHHFPGNEFSYGRVFVSREAEAYLAGGIVRRAGATIVKEAFRFAPDGRAQLHEIAAMRKDGPDGGWRWLKVDRDLKLHTESEPCLVCHNWKSGREFQFGRPFFARHAARRAP